MTLELVAVLALASLGATGAAEPPAAAETIPWENLGGPTGGPCAVGVIVVRVQGYCSVCEFQSASEIDPVRPDPSPNRAGLSELSSAMSQSCPLQHASNGAIGGAGITEQYAG